MNPTTGSSRGRARGWRRLLGRHRVVQRLAHQPSVHAELPRHPLDRPDRRTRTRVGSLRTAPPWPSSDACRRPHLLASRRIGNVVTPSRVGHSRASKWARPEYRTHPSRLLPRWSRPRRRPILASPGQTRYIANTEGQGVKLREACDDQAGSVGWPEGTAVTVVYARADCPEWLLVKRSDQEGSWVRIAYLADTAPVVAAAPAPPTVVVAAPPTKPSVPTATPVPKPSAPTATSVASKPAPKAPVAGLASGGLGLLRAEWERAKRASRPRTAWRLY